MNIALNQGRFERTRVTPTWAVDSRAVVRFIAWAGATWATLGTAAYLASL